MLPYEKKFVAKICVRKSPKTITVKKIWEFKILGLWVRNLPVMILISSKTRSTATRSNVEKVWRLDILIFFIYRLIQLRMYITSHNSPKNLHWLRPVLMQASFFRSLSWIQWNAAVCRIVMQIMFELITIWETPMQAESVGHPENGVYKLFWADGPMSINFTFYFFVYFSDKKIVGVKS